MIYKKNLNYKIDGAFFFLFFYFQFASHAALMFNTDFSSCAFVFVILCFIRQKKNLLKAKHKKYVNFFFFFYFSQLV